MQIERPRIITVIALWQFFRAALLLIVALILGASQDRKWGPLGFWQLIYITSNSRGHPGLVVVPFIIYAVAVGIGLWLMKRWARIALIMTSGITALWWLRYLALDWAIPKTSLSRTLQPGFDQQSAYMLIATDALIFLLLAFHPAVVQAFQSSERV